MVNVLTEKPEEFVSVLVVEFAIFAQLADRSDLFGRDAQVVDLDVAFVGALGARLEEDVRREFAGAGVREPQ